MTLCRKIAVRITGLAVLRHLFFYSYFNSVFLTNLLTNKELCGIINIE